MAGNLETGKPREPSDFDGEHDAIEVTARRPTTMAENLNARRSGRLKQEGGRLHDDPTDDAGHAAKRFRKAIQRAEHQPGDAPGTKADADPARHAPPDAGDEPEVSARKETSLADELGVQASGRLKQGQARQHGVRGGPDEPEGTKGHRSRSRTSRLRAESASDAPAEGDSALVRGTDSGHTARLRASKTARHALRFAEDAGAVANASVIGEDDGDASEDAVDETRKRIRPYGRRAISRTRKGSGAATTAAVPSATRAAPETGGAEAGTARLRDGPAFATKSGGKTAAS